MGELNWLLKGDGRIFESCDISLENTPTSHAVSLALVICTCSDSAMPLLSCACLHNNISGTCLPLVVQHVLRHKWGGIVSREKHSLQQFHFKKGGGLIFGRLRHMSYTRIPINQHSG